MFSLFLIGNILDLHFRFGIHSLFTILPSEPTNDPTADPTNDPTEDPLVQTTEEPTQGMFDYVEWNAL